MNSLTRIVFAGLLGALLSGAVHVRPLQADEAPKAPPKSAHAWTLEEAQKQLQLCPRDAYLQYVVLQLALREGKLAQVASEIHKARGGQPDPFSLFSGALALQEGMQLEALSGGADLKGTPAEGGELSPPMGPTSGLPVEGSSNVSPASSEEVPPMPLPEADTPSEATGDRSTTNTDKGLNMRMEQLLFQSEDLRQIHDEWQRFWLNDQPSHMTYQRVHGSVYPGTEELLPMPRPEQDEPAPVARSPYNWGGPLTMPPPKKDEPALPPPEKDESVSDTSPEKPPVGSVCEVASFWESSLVWTPDLANDGKLLVGLVGRMYLLSPDKPYPLACDGSLSVILYDDSPLATGGKPVALERWEFPKDVLPQALRKDTFGWGYTLCLPWVKSYRPDITQVHLRLCFTPTDQGPIYQHGKTMTLVHGKRPFLHSVRQVPGEVLPMPQENQNEAAPMPPAPSTGRSRLSQRNKPCQAPVIETGQTLPSGWYLRHYPQYVPPTADELRCRGGRLSELSDQEKTANQPPEPKEEPLPQAEILDVVPARVKLSTLKGPQIKRHNWEARLKGKPRPEVSALSRCVPDNFYLVEFRSVARLLDLLDSAEQWTTFFYNQSVHDARTQDVAARLQKQLAVEGDVAALRPFYDLVVEEVAITGSDLFVREGSDVTLLFRYRNEKLFKQHMDGMLLKAKAHPDAKKYTGRMLDVEYVHVETPDRTISVYSAYPEPGLHVRSNSRVGLKRVLEAIRGETAQGKPVRRLGETLEFLHARSLMPHGAAEEDGFLYLSEAFARHLASPKLKIAELRRLKAYNHLRMIGHAALMYRTEQGKAPDSLEALAEADCCPGPFNKGDLTAPGDGWYTLADDGLTGICGRFGTARFLTPCCEIPLKEATAEEAAAYQGFVEKHAQDWHNYLTPLAVRAKVSGGQIRLEAAVLALTANPDLALVEKFVGGPPEHLDALPVPKRNLFSINVRLNKQEIFNDVGPLISGAELMAVCAGDEMATAKLVGALFGCALHGPALATTAALVAADLEKEMASVQGHPETELMVGMPRFLLKGIGNQIGLHVYDQDVPFDLNLASLLGQTLAGLEGHKGGLGLESLGVLAIAVPVAACTAPGYLSVTVQDGRIVDDYLDRIDKALPGLVRGFASDLGGCMREVNGMLQPEFYKVKLKGGVTARSLSIRFGPARYRIHWARIGGGLYLANQLAVLEDIQAADRASRRGCCLGCGVRSLDRGPKAHAMIRMRARNWDQALPGFKLSWAENNRQACLCNLGPLSSAARALTAPPPGQEGKSGSWDDRMDQVQEHAARIHGARHFCPEGGRYVLSEDGKSVTCSVHGSMLDPRQPAAPADDSPTGRLMRQFGDFTAALTFTPEGPRVVVTIDRK